MSTKEEPVKKNTKMNYLYRDASNYKAHNEVIVRGEITAEQIARIIATLDGDLFIPEQVGLPIERPDSGLTVDDHCYCELCEGDFELVDEDATEDVGCEDLVQRFEEAAKEGWDDVKYGVFVDEEEEKV